jgi:hypothetical protein
VVEIVAEMNLLACIVPKDEVERHLGVELGTEANILENWWQSRSSLADAAGGSLSMSEGRHQDKGEGEGEDCN